MARGHGVTRNGFYVGDRVELPDGETGYIVKVEGPHSDRAAVGPRSDFFWAWYGDEELTRIEEESV